MSHFVYVIGNYQNSKFTTYVGHTGNLKKRLNLHNKGREQNLLEGDSGKSYIPKNILQKKKQ